jgi:mRNA-degrading endonuclease toxin of MazEF toxin-antitoxin module
LVSASRSNFFWERLREEAFAATHQDWEDHHPQLVDKVVLEHVGAVDATRLGDLAGHLTPEEMWGVDEALATVLDVR